MEQEKSLKEEIREMRGLIEQTKDNSRKPKPFKLPFKAKINKARLSKGYVTVGIINDNKSLDFIREPIIDGTIKLDDTFHAVEDFDIYSYKGKPFIFQPKSKLNPYNPLEGKHETYGQKYVMARMEGDKITSKKKMGLGISIGLVIILGIIGYALFTGGS